ncbi:FXYD domain-containing ion transport regulator 3 isoform X2 [Xenopus laevis]|uniref:FXYD domain-containing ion transport regulator n=1 Tax=Xenopus laevis TaxID=8355 RepID=A0A8J0TCB1_XENLA|nr:FXYD domain-containing ion transport regulator 3 isoform X2 [Xenopus laevis]
MQEATIAAFLMLTALPGLHATGHPDNSQLYYDYESLKIGGLIVAGVLCAMGIIILLSGKCRCKFNQNIRNQAQEQQLITPGSASNC